jgi:hypothetical protein
MEHLTKHLILLKKKSPNGEKSPPKNRKKQTNGAQFPSMADSAVIEAKSCTEAHST